MHIRLGHSPDPDDAFMFYGLAAGKVDDGGYEVEHVIEDIQTLNERATRGELEVTAMSLHAWSYVADKYIMTPWGGSFGDNYGPMIVTGKPRELAEVPEMTLAVPGELTTAFLLLRLVAPDVKYKVIPFDRIIPAVQAGEVDGGVIIHEGQLTYAASGLHCVLDLGKWWNEQANGLPLPLGVNAIRRDLGVETCRKLSDVLAAGVQYSLDHRREAVAYAMKYARDMGEDLADKFIGMYVNDLTLDAGESGRAGIAELLRRGGDAGIIPQIPEIEFVERM